MVATKALIGGRKKTHRHKRHLSKKMAPKRKPVRKVSVARRYVKPGDKKIARDPLHKCSKILKSGPHQGKCRVLLSKKGQKERARQRARKSHKKK